MTAPYFSLLTSISEINDYLYISGFAPVQEENLRKFGITCVVDATNVPKKAWDGVDFVKVTVEDHETAKLDVYFDDVADKIHQHRKEGGKTLVHCAAGISRSASLCIVYFVKYENLSLKEAYLLVHEKRRIISPNMGFWKQMIEYAKRTKYDHSVKLVRTKYREIPDVYLPNIDRVDKENNNAGIEKTAKY